jgi:flagellar motor switch protein FliN/FliY
MDPALSELSQKVGSSFTESMISVFSMLTGREFTVTAQDLQTIEHVDVANLFTGQVIFVKAQYTKGMTGTVLFSLPLKEGTMLVDLMLGGEGAPAEELAGDSRDALAETFNQVLGSANQTLSDMAGETLSIANVEIFATPSGDATALTDLLGPGPFLDLPLATAQDTLSTAIHLLIPDLLLQQLQRKLGVVEAPAPPAAEPAAPAPSAAAAMSAPAAGPSPSATTAFQMPSAPVNTGNLDLLLDIELPIMVRMGQTEMQLGELLKLTPGSILELNRAADAPVELLVNSKVIAKGEVVVVDGNFAFRITEIESTATRIRSLA